MDVSLIDNALDEGVFLREPLVVLVVVPEDLRDLIGSADSVGCEDRLLTRGGLDDVFDLNQRDRRRLSRKRNEHAQSHKQNKQKTHGFFHSFHKYTSF